MTYATPNPTTRPLFHLAQEHGQDYTDVLNVAWGIKQLLTGAEHPNVWYGPSLTRLMRDERGEPAFTAIQQHVSDFVFLQDTHRRETRTQALRDAIADRGEFPDDPSCRDY